MHFYRSVLIALILISAETGQAQCTNAVTLQYQSEIQFTSPQQAFASHHDNTGKAYLYVASNDQGLRIYDLSNVTLPVLVKTIPIDSFANMYVMNLTQSGNYLYLTLGNSFVTSSKPGMAIVDVTTPATAKVSTVWNWSKPSGGGGIVAVEGNYAYLGAMGQGLIILDIANKSNAVFVSQYIPSISFPNPVKPDSSKYNARGMVVKNSIVYLCYDAGGFRIINATNKSSPVETGRYSNSLLLNKTRAYNNVVINDTLAYIAVDYCGMEILNIADTAAIKEIGWWNPWNCQASTNDWFNSPGFANEIAYDDNCKLVFLASGNSNLDVVNVSNPAHPDSCTSYQGAGSGQGTWGVSLYQNELFLSYIYVPLCIPFCSNWGGVKMLNWKSPCYTTEVREQNNTNPMEIYPNPSNGTFTINIPLSIGEIAASVFTPLGKCVYSREFAAGQAKSFSMSMNDVTPGLYTLIIKSSAKTYYRKLLITK